MYGGFVMNRGFKLEWLAMYLFLLWNLLEELVH